MFSVTITDADGKDQQVEVSQEVYDFLVQDKKAMRNQERWNERHIEFSELTEEQLLKRIASKSSNIEEDYIQAELFKKINLVINECTDTQIRRFLLSVCMGKTNVEIAQIEGCVESAVRKSINLVKKRIKNLF